MVVPVTKEPSTLPSSVLPGFVSIGPRTSVYTPSQPIPGQLIIVCTWLGAAKKHITKYTSLYQLVAPGARILLIESNVPILVSSYARQGRRLRCAVSAVLDTLKECAYSWTGDDDNCDRPPVSEKEALLADQSHSMPSAPPQIVLHTFSNGGTNTATQLLINLHSALSNSPLPLCGILLDSSPAKGTYWKSYNAMVFSLPRDATSQIIGALAVHFLLTLLYSWIACGNENPASLMRRTLLDKGISKHVRQDGEEVEGEGRVSYLYSKEDKMTEWMDIREHAEDARRRGWMVEEEVFEGSAHCAHFSADSERYVRAVERVWKGEMVGDQHMKLKL